jgi:hypothetical protein
MRASLVGDACSDPKEDPIPSQAGFAVLEKKANYFAECPFYEVGE